MAQLFVDAEKIARARELARSAAMGVQAFIDRHTTVSVERTCRPMRRTFSSAAAMSTPAAA